MELSKDICILPWLLVVTDLQKVKRLKRTLGVLQLPTQSFPLSVTSQKMTSGSHSIADSGVKMMFENSYALKMRIQNFENIFLQMAGWNVIGCYTKNNFSLQKRQVFSLCFLKMQTTRFLFP